MNKEKKIFNENEEADEFFEKEKEDAKKDIDKSINLYRKYVGSAETFEERIRRINKFRCG